MEINQLLFPLLLISLCMDAHCLPWPFSSPSNPQKHVESTIPEFSMQTINDPKGTDLLENANRMVGLSNCWQEAYGKLFSSCSNIMVDQEKQSRLAWHLASCYQQDSGRNAFPFCDERVPMVNCRKKLNDFDQSIFLEFFLQTDSLCHHLQADAFKRGIETLINGLSNSATMAKQVLEIINERSEQTLENSNRILDSQASLQQQTQNLAKQSNDVENKLSDVLEHTNDIFQRSSDIAASQEELKKGQSEINDKIESGKSRIDEFSERLVNGIERLREEAVVIQSDIKSIGETMSQQMQDIQNTTNEIEDKAGLSLENQKRLLNVQQVALDGLKSLEEFLSHAIQENRDRMEKIAELGQRQQEEMVVKQNQALEGQDRMLRNQQTILTAQEEFTANVLMVLEKFSSMLKSLAVESRFIKSFFFYSCVVYFIYMLTSAKQTFGIRGQLYFGLCITVLLELGLIKIGEDDLDKQFSITSKIFWVRSGFLFAACFQILYSIFTFKDFERLNHQLLQTLTDKVRAMEASTGQVLLPGTAESEEGSLCDYSWICEELEDEMDSKVDPDYNFPEGIGENSITTSVNRRYNLRRRY